MIGIDRILYERVSHEEQMSADTEGMLEGRERLVEKHGETLSERQLASLYASIGHGYAQTDRTGKARRRFRKAIGTHPGRIDLWYYRFWLHFGLVGYRLGRGGHQRLYKPLMG